MDKCTAGTLQPGAPIKNSKQNPIPYDIWYLILTKQSWNDDKWLQNARTVSKDFDKIIKPLVYRCHIISAENTIRPDPAQVYPRFKANIITHCQYIGFKNDVESEYHKEMVQIVSRSKGLRGVTWQEGRGDPDRTKCISDSLQKIFERTRHALLILDRDFQCLLRDKSPIHNFDGEPDEVRSYSTGMGTGFMSNPKINEPASALTDLAIGNLPGGNDILTSHSFGRLPPITKLRLDRYHWRHTAENYRQVWDFSNLRVLILEWIDLCDFFTAVSVDDLVGLHAIGMMGDENTNHDLAGTRGPLAELFTRFKGLKILRLRHVRWQEILPPRLIYGLGETLERLYLQDIKELGDQDPVALSVSELERIRVHCPNIHDLNINWTLELDEQQQFLDILCRFENLEDIFLGNTMGVVADGIGIGTDRPDPDYDGAMVILDYLKVHKYGKPLKSVSVHARNSFRQRKGRAYGDGMALGERRWGYATTNGMLKWTSNSSERFDDFPDEEDNFGEQDPEYLGSQSEVLEGEAVGDQDPDMVQGSAQADAEENDELLGLVSDDFSGMDIDDLEQA